MLARHRCGCTQATMIKAAKLLVKKPLRLGRSLTVVSMPFFLNECGSKETCREEHQRQNRK